MQFAVPQFIDVEDKLIGPFTLKQFGIVFGVGIIDVLLYKVFGLGIIFILFGVPLALAGIALAFVPFNGRQLYQTIPLFVNFLSKPRVYVFRHVAPSIESMHLNKPTDKKPQTALDAASASLENPQSALKRLTLLLDQKTEEQTELISKIGGQSNGN
jgi:hypothetical protein